MLSNHFSKHAVQRMQERDITLRDITDTVMYGKKYDGDRYNDDDVSVLIYRNVRVVVNLRELFIITVTRV